MGLALCGLGYGSVFGQRRGHEKFIDIPPMWLLLFIIIVVFCAWMFPAAGHVPYLAVAGWLFSGAGAAIILWSGWWFWQRKTPIEPRHEPKVLIVEGPYRMSRNPIYLGMVLIILGVILWWGQLLCLVLLPVFVTVINRRFILPEEAGLRRAFGAQAEVYLQKTRRWI